jgi:hypothetical protein
MSRWMESGMTSRRWMQEEEVDEARGGGCKRRWM